MSGRNCEDESLYPQVPDLSVHIGRVREALEAYTLG